MRRRASRVGREALLLVLLGGCTEELPDAALIERPRLLGARLVVPDAPERAWPVAGEEARVRWPLAFPREAEPFSSAMIVCPLAPGRYGLPACEEGTVPAPLRPCDEARPWEACGQMRVPSARAGEVLVLGLLCMGGQVRLDPGAVPPVRCEGGELQEGLLLRHPLWDGNGEPNRHPPSPGVLLDGAAVPSPPEDWRVRTTEPCPDEPLLPVVAPRAPGREAKGDPPHRFVMRLAADAAEVLPGGGPDAREQLTAAHLVTAGKLARRFGAPEPAEDGGWRWDVGYWPPEADEVPAGGRLVRLHVTVRDGRGGFVEAMRAFCVR